MISIRQKNFLCSFGQQIHDLSHQTLFLDQTKKDGKGLIHTFNESETDFSNFEYNKNWRVRKLSHGVLFVKSEIFQNWLSRAFCMGFPPLRLIYGLNPTLLQSFLWIVITIQSYKQQMDIIQPSDARSPIGP